MLSVTLADASQRRLGVCGGSSVTVHGCALTSGSTLDGLFCWQGVLAQDDVCACSLAFSPSHSPCEVMK